MQSNNNIMKLDDATLANDKKSGLKRIYAIQVGPNWIKCQVNKGGDTWLISLDSLESKIKASVDEWRCNLPAVAAAFREAFGEDEELRDVKLVPYLPTPDISGKVFSLALESIALAKALSEDEHMAQGDSTPRRQLEHSLALVAKPNGDSLLVDECKILSFYCNGTQIVVDVDLESKEASLAIGPIMAWGTLVPTSTEPSLNSPLS